MVTSGGHQVFDRLLTAREKERRLSGGGESQGLEGESRSRSAATGRGRREARGGHQFEQGEGA